MGFSKETLPQSYHKLQKSNFYLWGFFCPAVLLNLKIDDFFVCLVSIVLLN